MQPNFDPLGTGGFVSGAMPGFAPPQQAKQPAKKKKNFWLDQLSTAGGIIGGIGGSFAAPIAGTVAGGAAGSALGEALENLIMGESAGKNVAKEAILGGVLAPGPLKLIGAATKGAAKQVGKSTAGARTGQKIEEAGNRLLGSQANLTRADARKAGVIPSATLGNINRRTGLTSIDDMAALSENVTGSQGVLSELTRNAIGNTKGVDIGDLRTVASDLLVDKAPLLGKSARGNVIDQIKNSTVKAYGGSKGSLSPLADPYEAFDVARSFEAQAARLRSLPTPRPEDGQLADVYQSLADTIKTRLFSAQGVQEGLEAARPGAQQALQGLARDAGSKAQRNAYTRLADEVPGLGDINAVRGAQRDFVGLGKIEEATARARAGAGAQLGDQMQGAGRLVQNPWNLLAVPLNAATPRVGGQMTRAGRAIQGEVLPNTAPSARGITARVGGVGAVRGALNAGAPAEPLQEPQTLEDALMMQQGMDIGGMGALAEQTAPQSVYSQEALLGDIQRDPENYDQYLELYEALNPEPEEAKQQSAYGRPSAEKYSLGTSGLTSLDELEQMISQNPGVVARNATPGQGLPIVGGLVSRAAGTGEYKAIADNVIDSLARARTGAAMRAEEESFYRRLLPREGDSQATIQAKMQQLRQAFAPFVTYGGPATLEDALMMQYAQ